MPMNKEDKQNLSLFLRKEQNLLKNWLFEQIDGYFGQDPMFLKGAIHLSHELQKLIKGDNL